MTLLDYLFAVVPMLGILIFVHELGHFVVAKACGVRVLKFSLGFGPPIGFGRLRARWVRNGTEYVIAWFPIGGFVKMLGEALVVQGDEPPPEEVIDARPDEYLNSKPVWQKLAITFAGPAMNLLLPVAAFSLVLWFGIPKAASVIGTVEPESPAYEAGLEPGDRVLEIDGQPVQWWEEVSETVREHPDGVLPMRVARGDETLDLRLEVESRSGLDEFGGVRRNGWIGLGSRRLPALIGVPDGSSVAASAGLRSGDRVTRLGGEEVEDWEALRGAYEAAGGTSVALEVARRDDVDPVHPSEGSPPTQKPELVTLDVPVLGSLEALGVVSATILVHSVSEGSPAARAGLEPGDLILSVDDSPIGSFTTFQETVRASEGRSLELVFARDGRADSVVLEPELKKMKGALGFEEEFFLIGITHASAMLPGVETLDRERNPLVAIPRAAEMTVNMAVLFLRGLGKLASGDVGTDKLAGPIGIAEIARASLDLGWQAYLYTMILISINLGFLNLLPIPILDGGQALIYAVEGIQRAPISTRTRELVQQFGFTVLVMLMGLAFWNDISRNWSRFVEWLSG